MSKPLKVQIVERAHALIADEEHWCRCHFAEDANGFGVSATSARAIKWCGLGAVIAAAYQLTHNTDAAYQIVMREVMLLCSRCSTELSLEADSHSAVERA